MNFLSCLFYNFKTCVVLVGKRVCRIFKLLGNKYIGIFILHALCGFQTFVNTVADVACVVNKHNLSTVMTHKHSAFLAYRVRHDNNRLIALYRTDKGKTDTLVAAGRLHNYCILIDKTLFLGCDNHIVGCTGLD